MPYPRAPKKRVVVKVGSALLRHPQGGLREPVVAHIVAAVLHPAPPGARGLILVSSGAIALGIQVLGAQGIPTHHCLSTGGRGDWAESSDLDL